MHRHAAPGTRVEIDVVESDAEPADRDEPGPRREQASVDARAVADDQRAGGAETARDAGGVGMQIVVVVDVEVGAQGVDGTRVHELGDDDVRHWSSTCAAS